MMSRARFKRVLSGWPFLYRAAKSSELLALRVRRGVHEEDFRGFASLCLGPGWFVDVGANYGQSAISIASVRPDLPVVSFEPNPRCMWALRATRMVVPRLEVHHVGLSATDGTRKLYVPRTGGVEHTQEATMVAAVLRDEDVRSRVGRSFEVEAVTVDVRRFEHFDRRVAAVKIDVQGSEEEVVHGLLSAIERDRPAMLLENSDATPRIVDLLGPLGYRAHRYFPGLHRFEPIDPSDPEPQNAFLLTDRHLRSGGEVDGTVDVVIVDYASPDLLEAVASAASLEEVNAVHVVDNHGRTPWSDVDEAVGEVRLHSHRRTRNLGFGGGINRALATVTSPYVLVLNPDARIDRWDLGATIGALRERDAAIAAPNVAFRDGRPQAVHGPLPSRWTAVRRALGAAADFKIAEHLPAGEVRKVGWVAGVAFLADAGTLRRIGGFDERYFLYWEDIDLCRRLRRAGQTVLRVGYGSVVHRNAGTQHSRVRNRVHVARSLLRYAIGPSS